MAITIAALPLTNSVLIKLLTSFLNYDYLMNTVMGRSNIYYGGFDYGSGHGGANSSWMGVL